jgi:Ser/Thr protein kinase RdoA (MazF antagonist)
MSSLNENIEYRILSINECDRISEIDPSQWNEKALRNVDILRAWDINTVVDFEEYVTSAIRFTTANGKNYVLKRKGNIKKIDTEHELLKHIQNNGIVVPVPLKTAEGNLYVEKDGVNYTLYDYIEGNTIKYDFEKNNREVLFKHGQVLGKLHRVMNTYNGSNKGIVDMNIENEVLNWAIPLINENIFDNRSKEIMDDIANEMKDIFAKLPKQYIHRDPHGCNILFQGDIFIGFIDFDLCKIGYKVFDLCYVMTGVLMDGFEKEENKEKWLGLITQISSGYETENSIEPMEKKCFWYIFLAIQMICTAWFYHINDSKMAKLNIEALYWIYDNKETIESKIK